MPAPANRIASDRRGTGAKDGQYFAEHHAMDQARRFDVEMVEQSRFFLLGQLTDIYV
jgi:hypothetical protein